MNCIKCNFDPYDAMMPVFMRNMFALLVKIYSIYAIYHFINYIETNFKIIWTYSH